MVMNPDSSAHWYMKYFLPDKKCADDKSVMLFIGDTDQDNSTSVSIQHWTNWNDKRAYWKDICWPKPSDYRRQQPV